MIPVRRVIFLSSFNVRFGFGMIELEEELIAITEAGIIHSPAKTMAMIDDDFMFLAMLFDSGKNIYEFITAVSS